MLATAAKRIVNGQAHSRSCAQSLVDDAEDLRYHQGRGAFPWCFWIEPDEVIIVDILHSRSDLPRHIAALTALRR